MNALGQLSSVGIAADTVLIRIWTREVAVCKVKRWLLGLRGWAVLLFQRRAQLLLHKDDLLSKMDHSREVRMCVTVSECRMNVYFTSLPPLHLRFKC
jgi:hypothetical protein